MVRSYFVQNRECKCVCGASNVLSDTVCCSRTPFYTVYSSLQPPVHKSHNSACWSEMEGDCEKRRACVSARGHWGALTAFFLTPMSVPFRPLVDGNISLVVYISSSLYNLPPCRTATGRTPRIVLDSYNRSTHTQNKAHNHGYTS